jgi:hypothetical protein
MAGKPINTEELKPSYEEVINELNINITKLIMENSIMKVSIKKLEDAIANYNSSLPADKKKETF